MWHLDGFPPLPSADLPNLREVARPDPEDNLFRCYLFRTSPLEKRGKLAQSTRTDVIQRGDLFPKFFITPHKYLGVRKSKSANNFRYKSGLFDVGFDQKDPQSGSDDFERQTRESSPRTHVGEPTILHRCRCRSVHAFAEVTIKYRQWIANRSQIHSLIPAQQNPYILLNLKDLLITGGELELAERTADGFRR